MSSNFVVLAESPGNANHLIVSYPSNNRNVLGYLFRPDGKGPFPAVIYHHGSAQALMNGPVSRFARVAEFFTSHGYMLFVPDRRTQGLEKSDYSPALQRQMEKQPNSPAVKEKQLLEKTEIINQDVVACVEWLKKQPDVDTNRIAMMGLFFGAIQTIVAAPKDIGVRSFMAFAPAVTTWQESVSLQELLLQAVHNAKGPVFLIFNENSHSLVPAAALGHETAEKGLPNRTKIYPAFGKTADDARAFVNDGIKIWGPDAIKFLEETLR